jgi:hypothetical protein
MKLVGFVVFRLGQEANQQFELAAPIIIFFGLTEKEQLAVIPVLNEKKKYDFPQGDLITSNALEILISGYQVYLNVILLNLITMLDESDNENIKNLVGLVEQLLETTRKILEGNFEPIGNASSLGAFEWDNLRQFSSAVQRELKIQLEVNTKIMKSCVEYWLHP